MSDNYETPKYAFESILPYIPKDKLIWDPFFCNGLSGQYMAELGLNVYHEDSDFFQSDHGDMILTNPPFSKKKDVLHRMILLNKPFIMLLPSSTINYQYFQKLFRDRHIQLLIPSKRVQFIKNRLQTKGCSFDCMWFAYKMDLPKDITFLA
jgi:hypothetical protein